MRRLGVLMISAAAAAGCKAFGAQGFLGTAITRGGDVRAQGDPIDGGSVSSDVTYLDLGAVGYQGPLFVDFGVLSGRDSITVRSADRTMIVHDGHPAALLYTGFGVAARDGEVDHGRLYARLGFSGLAGGAATTRAYEAGVEVCPWSRPRLSACGRLSLLWQRGTAVPSFSEPRGEFAAWGPMLQLGGRWGRGGR